MQIIDWGYPRKLRENPDPAPKCLGAAGLRERRVEELAYHRAGPAKLEVFATRADYKKAGPLLFPLDHCGTRNGDPLHLFFSHVAVKLVGSNTWIDAR